MTGDESLHDCATKDILRIQHKKRDAELVGDAAGVAHLRRRAAAIMRRATHSRLRPQAHHHADHIITSARQQRRGNGAIHAAAHSDDNALGSLVHPPQSPR